MTRKEVNVGCMDESGSCMDESVGCMDKKELSNEDFVGYDGDAALFIGGYCSEIKQGANKKDREMSINSSFDIHALHNNYIVDFVL